MSEFDKLKDDAEQQAREDPRQVSEGGQTGLEKKLGMNSEQDQTSRRDQNTAPESTDEMDLRQGS